MAADPIKVLVVGARGRMGAQTCRAVESAADLELVAQVEREDDLVEAIRRTQPAVGVDFTSPKTVDANLRTLVELGVHPVIGTTGWNPDVLEEMRERARLAGLGGVVAPNFAIGAVLMIELAARAARYLSQVSIIECHHTGKLDAPSGTSLRTQERIRRVVDDQRTAEIHSLRQEGFLAHQEVILGGPGERLTIRHDTLDRGCFMPGLLLAIRRAPELREIVVGLESLLE